MFVILSFWFCQPSPLTYIQAAALCFINTVVQTAHGPNAKVFHQHEFLEAGFSVQEVEKSLHGRQDERVLHELREWVKNFIDIQQYIEDMAVARGRARDLKDDVSTELTLSLCRVFVICCLYSWKLPRGAFRRLIWTERTSLNRSKE